ncbi:MAG: thermonuclease family protein [Proteobacteria bacterium]|nr:thermonuclease family protein [Pseudomonadota bacterium]
MIRNSNRRGVGLAALALWALAVLAPAMRPALAGEIVGRPEVIDGDTLDFSGRIVRLYGIDAPELEQSCRAAGRTWPCGKEARWAAINRIHPHWVTCVEKGRAPDRAILAVCYLAGIGQHDLNAWLVREGWALAERGARIGRVLRKVSRSTGDQRGRQREQAQTFFLFPLSFRRQGSSDIE